MTPEQRTAMQQAIDALIPNGTCQGKAALKALRQSLEAPEFVQIRTGWEPAPALPVSGPVTDAEIDSAFEVVSCTDTVQSMRRALEGFAAGRAAAPIGIPSLAGWQLVPVEPTPEMLDAPPNLWSADAKIAYAAMLAAAPKPPTSEGAAQ